MYSRNKRVTKHELTNEHLTDKTQRYSVINETPNVIQYGLLMECRYIHVCVYPSRDK